MAVDKSNKETPIMAWGLCEIEIGKTGSGDTMAASLTNIGHVKEKTTTLTPDLGTPLEAWASGHKLVAREYPDETLRLETTVIEPTSELKQMLGIEDASGKVKTHVITDFYSLKLTPHHKGATGIKAPKCNITYEPGVGEETGNEVKLTFEITKTAALEENYWYETFTTEEELS